MVTAMAMFSFSHCVPNRGALHCQDLLSVSRVRRREAPGGGWVLRNA